MTEMLRSVAAAAMAAMLLIGCEPSPTDGTQGTQQSGDGGADHTAQGTLNSADPASGTVNISHEPVESAGWPSMTMNFQLADPELAADLSPGQRVQFRFSLDDGNATVTEISPLESGD